MTSEHDFVELCVIVPCHNVGQTLGEQLDALVVQEWAGTWQILVVDNGSTDNTASVASQYGSRSVPLEILSATEGQSVAYARNAGVQHCSSRSVAFCDGDDIVQAGWVAAMGEALRSNELVTGSIETAGINEPWLAETRPNNSGRELPTFGSEPFARGCNSGMSKALWQRLSGYDEEFRGLEDIEFSLRAAAIGIAPTFVPDAVVAYRYRPGLRPLWRQSYFYGRGISALSRQARVFGFEGPATSAALKSWLWLIPSLARIGSRTGRYAWVWVFAHRIGALRGALDARRAAR